MASNGIAAAGGGFNKYSAGKKVYGNGRPMPTVGPVNPLGHAQRDARLKARNNALLRFGQKEIGRKHYG